MVSDEENKRMCAGCDMCCRHVTIELDEPDCDEDFDNIIWYLMHENVHVWIDDDESWYVEFNTPCKALKDNLCTIYHKRPQVCRDYTQENCIGHNGHGEAEEESFHTPEDFLKYLKECNVEYEGFYQENSKE